MSSGQINQFKFASHVSKLSNAGRLHPDSDVHSTAVYHPKKYPGAAWASFPLASPSPAAVPGGIWHQTDLPFPCLWTMSLFPPPPPPFLCPEPHEDPYAVSHTFSIQERGVSVHLQHVSAFHLQQKKPVQRKPGLGKGGAWLCTPCYLPPRYPAFGPSPKGSSTTRVAQQQQKGLSVQFGQGVDGPQSCH